MLGSLLEKQRLSAQGIKPATGIYKVLSLPFCLLRLLSRTFGTRLVYESIWKYSQIFSQFDVNVMA